MTPRWKAKSVKKLVTSKWGFTHPIHSHYETESGRKFKWFNSSSMTFNRDTKFYILRHTGDHKSVDYRFWIYPIPFNIATIDHGSGTLHTKWFDHMRDIVIEVK